jgi:hypothetical protein
VHLSQNNPLPKKLCDPLCKNKPKTPLKSPQGDTIAKTFTPFTLQKSKNASVNLSQHNPLPKKLRDPLCKNKPET